MNRLSKNYWQRAINSIPGGTGLLSKRPERYAPDVWPTYFKKAKGVIVNDLDNNQFIDMAQMGLGSSILGYANEELNDEVKNTINKGINCTLNSIEEVLLAEKLIELNNFAGGVRFARTGGEAMAIAIRIARAYSGKDKVAFSGYHGWCDWYLATNLVNKNALSNHLLPGLLTKGVPSGLANTAIPFEYNNVEDLERVLNLHPDIGILCLEGARYNLPDKEFIKKINKLKNEKNLLIVADEITSGWRMTDGGVYKITGLLNDLVVYAKALGGGFAISAIVGKKEIMDIAQETFMSSTMWTERVGFVAALKTIEIIKREKVWDHLIKLGKIIAKGWLKLSIKHQINIKISNFYPLITMNFCYDDRNNTILTLFIQEMLKRGFLSSNSVYLSYAHTEEIIIRYLNSVDEVFKILAEAINKKNELSLLNTKTRTDAFVRLTS